MDSIPIVIITGQVPTTMIGTDAFQEVDITGISDPITKHNYLVKDPPNCPYCQRGLLYREERRPGPVLIDMPRNVAAAAVEYRECSQFDLRGYKPKVTGLPVRSNRSAKCCSRRRDRSLRRRRNNQFRVLGGTDPAGGKPADPVVNTLMGWEAFLEHPWLWVCWVLTCGQANMAVQCCDLFVALGMRFTDRVTGCVAKFAPQAKIIHIDVDTAEIGKNVRVDIPLVGDLKIALNQLNSRLQRKKNPEWMAEIAAIKEKNPLKTETQISQDGEDSVSSADVMIVLNKKLPPSSIVTTDLGQHQILSAQLYHARKPRTFISSGGLGTMGYGIPAAVGAQVASPGATVVVITGDGSFQMGVPELGTALEQGLPLKILIMNNQTLGMVKQLQDHYCEGRHAAVHFRKNPDFNLIAKAYGALSLTVCQREELEEKMRRFLEHPGMAVLEVKTSSRENVYPMVLAGCGLNEMVGLIK